MLEQEALAFITEQRHACEESIAQRVQQLSAQLVADGHPISSPSAAVAVSVRKGSPSSPQPPAGRGRQQEGVAVITTAARRSPRCHAAAAAQRLLANKQGALHQHLDGSSSGIHNAICCCRGRSRVSGGRSATILQHLKRPAEPCGLNGPGVTAQR